MSLNQNLLGVLEENAADSEGSFQFPCEWWNSLGNNSLYFGNVSRGSRTEWEMDELKIEKTPTAQKAKGIKHFFDSQNLWQSSKILLGEV